MAASDGWFERLLLPTRRSSYVLLAALVVDAFFVPPLVDLAVLPLWFAAAATTVTLLASAIALGGHRAARGLIFGVASLALASRWLHAANGIDTTVLLDASAMAVATGTFAGMLLADVFAHGKLPDRLIAGLLAYIFIGTTWAQIYHAIDTVRPGALSLPGTVHSVSEYIYFSFATLTSVGYGDVLPVNPIVRSLAVLEALTGQLYLVLVVSRFVGEQAAGRAPPDR